MAHAEIVNCSLGTVIAGFILGIISIAASTIPCCIMCCCAKGPQVCCLIPTALNPWLQCWVLQASPSYSQTRLRPSSRFEVGVKQFCSSQVGCRSDLGCCAVWTVQHGYNIQPASRTNGPIHWTTCWRGTCWGRNSLRGTSRT